MTALERREQNPALVDIPDPLEGVIEGETRAERYRTFTTEVLGKIWRPGTDSGEYGDDFWRASRYNDGDVSGYIQFQPTAVDLINLDPDQFETAVSNLGTQDYVRVRSIPSQLATDEATVIPVGGSCAIETWGMRITTEIRAGIEAGILMPEMLPNVARQMLEMAPTISHVSGAVLSGQPATVHLIEDDMWAARITDYGVSEEEASARVSQAYQRINAAVARRAKLINPDAEVIQVNFDELDLKPALTNWFSELGIPYDSSHRVLEVIQSYVGPNQLEMVKTAIRKQLANGSLNPEQSAAALPLLEAQYHMRGKQIDHGRWGSMFIPKDVIIGERDLNPEETDRFNADYAFAAALSIMRSVHYQHSNGGTQSLVSLFADLPSYRNSVQHQDRDVGISFTGRPGEESFMQSVDASLSNHRRLHRLNVDEHLAWLATLTEDNTVKREELISAKKALLVDLSPLNHKLKDIQSETASCTSRVERLNIQLSQNTALLDLFDYLKNPETEPANEQTIRNAKLLQSRIRRIIESALFRQQHEPENLTIEDERDLAELPDLELSLIEIQQGSLPNLNAALHARVVDFEQNTQKNIQSLTGDLAEPAAKLTELTIQQEETLQLVEPLKQREAAIMTGLSNLSMPDFPLSDNPFVHHAMQFLWDPDFARFLTKAVTIQEAVATNGKSYRNTARIEMRNLYQAIYPKLEAYIRYLYGQRDYPATERQTKYLD